MSADSEPEASSSAVSHERVVYLWSRVKHAVFTLGRLSSMTRNIQLYGSTQMTYTQKQSKAQLDHVSSHVTERCVLLPSSPPRRLWTFLMVLVMIYTALITPYRICFVDETELNWLVTETCIDTVFFIDVVLTCFTAYKDGEQKLVGKRTTIMRHYATSWFLVDTAACIPFQLFEPDLQSQKYNKFVRLMRLPRLYKLMRLARLVKMFKFKASQEELVFKLLRMNRAILHLVKFVCGYAVMVHILACLWYYMARLDDDQMQTWPYRYGLMDRSSTELYVTSVYWVLTTLATVGYGDIVAYTAIERSFAIVILISCVAFFSYAISNVSSLVSSSDIRSTNLHARLNALEDFSEAVYLPDYLKQKAKQTLM